MSGIKVVPTTGTSIIYCVFIILGNQSSGSWFNINMSSYQYRKSHCGDKTVGRPSYLHNGISYTGTMSSLYWIGALDGIVGDKMRINWNQMAGRITSWLRLSWSAPDYVSLNYTSFLLPLAITVNEWYWKRSYLKKKHKLASIEIMTLR